MSSVLTTAWSRLLFGTLARAGVTDVVISPGSRSTPFAWAALNTPGLRCHAVVDERSAGFFALGQARISGRPSALVCTSGSAAAHYFPAIVEASQSFLPLVVLTADRPFELMDCGAAQAMDQTKLYGGYVRHFFELGQPDPADAALDALVRKVAQAVALSTVEAPGPVHLNARARKPLEPSAARTSDGHALEQAVEARLARGPTLVVPSRVESISNELDTLLEACSAASSGLIVCGPLPANGPSPAPALFELARRTGFAVCAEATSQLRDAEKPNDVCLLGSLEAAFSKAGIAPGLLLQIGATPTSSAYDRWLTDSTVRRAVVSAQGWPDPTNRAEWLVRMDAVGFARRLSERLPAVEAHREASRRAFRDELERREARYWQIVDSVVDEEPRLSEARAVKLALASLPNDALLGLGNSLALRDVDSFVRPSPRGARVFSQRGVNGIDGLVAGAAGAADIARRPTLLLLGDVSLLHDLGSLSLARSATTPLVLCVLDNGGGRIFDELPIRATLGERPELAHFWLTPPELDLQKAAQAFGVAYRRAEDPQALESALETAFAHAGCSLVHAVVVPESAREARGRVRERFAAEALAR